MALTRRSFLAASAAVGLAGCSATSTPHAATASTPASTATPAPAATGDLSTLGANLDGRLLRPGEPGYRSASQLFNPRFDGSRPRGVAQVASTDDVRRVVDFARDHDLPLALRSGGHGYGGWATGPGLVLDVRRLHRVRVDGSTATVQSGARLVDVYAGLAKHGRGIAAGSCPTVGIAGLTLGGGVGVLSRAWGLTCDQLTGVDLVTADGALRHASADRNPDLFWACRGGGGAQVGVATTFHFATHAASPVAVFFLRWTWARAAAVLRAWRDWSPAVPDGLWSTCKLLTQPAQRTPRVFVAGAWLGSSSSLAGHLDSLVREVGHAPAARSATTYSYLDAMLREAGCSDARTCTTPRTAYDSASNVLLRPLPDAAIDVAIGEVERRQSQRRDHEDGVSFDALGGRVARLAPDATAFPYRHAVAVAQYNVTWTPGTASTTVRRDRRWLHDFRTAMTRELGDHAYVNYADASLADYAPAYYGANHTRLAAIRQRYDPTGLFGFPQSAR